MATFPYRPKKSLPGRRSFVGNDEHACRRHPWRCTRARSRANLWTLWRITTPSPPKSIPRYRQQLPILDGIPMSVVAHNSRLSYSVRCPLLGKNAELRIGRHSRGAVAIERYVTGKRNGWSGQSDRNGEAPVSRCRRTMSRTRSRLCGV